MVFIWKGLGLIVPILLVIIGYIVSLFFENKTLGNTNLLGWVFFYSAIIFILVGLAIARPSEEEKTKTGKKLSLWRHTFFFLPILFWGTIFLILCIYLLLIYNPNPVDKFDTDVFNTEQIDAELTPIHFYNPTGDSLEYEFADPNGRDDMVTLEGYASDIQYSSGEIDQSYLIAGTNLAGEITMIIQPKDKENYDKNKFKIIEADGEKFYFRKIKKPTTETNDVDDVWVLLDSQYNLALVDVTNLYVNGKLKKDLITKVNWSEKIIQKYAGDAIVEVDLFHPEKDGKIKIISPNSAFPEEKTVKTKVYLLMDYLSDKDLNNKFITKELVRLTTD